MTPCQILQKNISIDFNFWRKTLRNRVRKCIAKSSKKIFQLISIHGELFYGILSDDALTSPPKNISIHFNSWRIILRNLVRRCLAKSSKNISIEFNSWRIILRNLVRRRFAKFSKKIFQLNSIRGEFLYGILSDDALPSPPKKYFN